jgi:3-oxoacyl-[acyl-carrier protein] reductase
LVNNAGVFKFEPFECISVAEFNREFSTNVLGPILAIQETIKQFGFKEGRVINISSLAGSHSLPNGILYSATKAAVENLTQGLSAELGSRRIRVNAIAPGYTRSEGTAAEGLLGEENVKHYISNCSRKLLPGKWLHLPKTIRQLGRKRSIVIIEASIAFPPGLG